MTQQLTTDPAYFVFRLAELRFLANHLLKKTAGTAYRKKYPPRLMRHFGMGANQPCETKVPQRLKAIFDCTPAIRTTVLYA